MHTVIFIVTLLFCVFGSMRQTELAKCQFLRAHKYTIISCHKIVGAIITCIKALRCAKHRMRPTVANVPRPVCFFVCVCVCLLVTRMNRSSCCLGYKLGAIKECVLGGARIFPVKGGTAGVRSIFSTIFGREQQRCGLCSNSSSS